MLYILLTLDIKNENVKWKNSYLFTNRMIRALIMKKQQNIYFMVVAYW